jgi:membrane protein DedA with SNARE-associated domain
MSGDFSSFSYVFQWVIAHGYPLMFLAMCAEGPTVTAAATFAATLGFFNPFIVFILSILGDVIPDVIFYLIGYWGRLRLVKKFGHRFGLTEKRIEGIEEAMHKHGGKTVAVLKYTPVVAAPGLMLVGAMRMNWWKYLWFVFIVTLQKTLMFMLIGYFFGRAYNIGKYIKYGALAPLVIIVLYFIVAFLYKRYSAKIVSKIEKI